MHHQKNTILSLAIVLGWLATTAACGGVNLPAGDAGQDEAGGDVSNDASVEDEDGAAPPNLALTANATFDFSSGTYSVINLDDLSVKKDAASIHSDAVARCAGGRLFLVERRGADTLTLIDSADPFSILSQFSVETGSNPIDLALLGSGRAVVTRNSVNSAAVIDLAGGGLDTTSLDVSTFADSDGFSEMSGVIVAGGRIFIALQLLDQASPLWSPTGPGVVAVFDAETLAPIDVNPVTDVRDGITLTGKNPLPGLQAAPHLENVALVAEVGLYGESDGGIEGFNTGSFEKTGLLVTEATLGGDIAAWAVASAESGYALISKAGFAGDKLVRFNPTTGALVQDAIVERGAYTLTGLALTRDNRLLVVDRTLEAAGILVFDAASGQKLSETPIATGVDPFSICVL